MDSLSSWSKLFSSSSFFAINKEEELAPDLKNLQSKIIFDPAVKGYHPNRRNEFILGRVCASKAHEMRTGRELLSLPSNKDRSAEWPSDVVGTISHNQHWVGAAVAKKTDLIGLGIDFEVMGRTKIELASHIRSSGDIQKHPKLSDEELLTIIFSSKESLYKALYPSVKKFFGFEDAALREIDLDNGLFTIDLLTDLTLNFGPNSRQSFQGHFTTTNKTCLTVLEISHED
jgi:enterobactin synthetase component D